MILLLGITLAIALGHLVVRLRLAYWTRRLQETEADAERLEAERVELDIEGRALDAIIEQLRSQR